MEGTGVGNDTTVLTGEGEGTSVLTGEGEGTSVLAGVSDVGVDDVEPEVAVTAPGAAISAEPTESDFKTVAVGITRVGAGFRDG